MSRAKWKGMYCPVLTVTNKKINNNESKIKIWSRNSVIPVKFLNKTVWVYTGKIFRKVIITKEKLGYKFGEFSFTRVKNQKKKVKKKVVSQR